MRPAFCLITAALFWVGASNSFGQAAQLAQNPQGATTTAVPNANQVRPDYVLGPNDQILIRAPQADEINERPFRIDGDGFINLPIVGRIRAGSQTVQSFETDLVTKLKEYIRDPQVFVTVVQFRSEPVFFVGDFNRPGIYTLQGRRTLIEMLSSVGGLQPNASRRIKITRRSEYGSIPLGSAQESPDRKISTVEISLDSLTQNVNPEEDIVLQPYDIVSAERAGKIYISGEVNKPASIELAERDSMPITQALTEVGGFTLNASRDKVRVLRPIAGTSRKAEIDIDLKRVFEGKDIDFPLLPNDVLYVPRATARVILTPVATSMLTTLPYLIVTLAVSGVF